MKLAKAYKHVVIIVGALALGGDAVDGGDRRLSTSEEDFGHEGGGLRVNKEVYSSSSASNGADGTGMYKQVRSYLR